MWEVKMLVKTNEISEHLEMKYFDNGVKMGRDRVKGEVMGESRKSFIRRKQRRIRGREVERGEERRRGAKVREQASKRKN